MESPRNRSARENSPIQPKTSTETPVESESVQVPEYWVARPERPPSQEYIGFQVEVAREIATRLGVPLSEMADLYTPIFHPYLYAGTSTYLDVNRMSNEELTQAIYERESAYAARQPHAEYHDVNRYGCFSYFAHTGGTGEYLLGRVDIHFSNSELDESGPLEAEKIDRRTRELKDMFTAIKKDYPEAQYVRGDSWLYNIEAYKRLFPETYADHPEIDTSRGALATGRTWGQFFDNQLGLKKDIAEQFLQNLRALDEITPESVRETLPYQALIVTAPIEEFYKKYGVE